MKDRADVRLPALWRHHPGAAAQRWIMSHVLGVAALEVGNPVVMLVLVKGDDPPLDSRAVGKPHRRDAASAANSRLLPVARASFTGDPH